MTKTFKLSRFGYSLHCSPNFCINFLMVLEINFVYPIGHFEIMLAGLSLRGRDRGFPPVTINMAPSYFHRKSGEKYNQKKFLAVWFPTYLLYLPSNLKPKWHPWLKTAPCGRFARGTLLLFLRFYLKLETLIIMGKFSCCVPGCTSNWRNSPNVKFHTLPTQPNVKETYVRLIRNATLKKDVLTTRICAAHFPNGENIWAPDRNWGYDLAYTGRML